MGRMAELNSFFNSTGSDSTVGIRLEKISDGVKPAKNNRGSDKEETEEEEREEEEELDAEELEEGDLTTGCHCS
jgi:hypothetical protein